MRKVILNLATSLDWYIEWSKWEYDWCFTDQDYGFSDFSKSVDTMFMWRKSYELFSNDMSTAFPNMKQIVFSSTLKDDKIKIISENIEDEVNKIKKDNWKDIWMFWWAKLTKSLLDLKLIDEIQIWLHPLILWSWTPLFLGSDERIKLKLLSNKSYSSWMIILKYEVEYKK